MAYIAAANISRIRKLCAPIIIQMAIEHRRLAARECLIELSETVAEDTRAAIGGNARREHARVSQLRSMPAAQHRDAFAITDIRIAWRHQRARMFDTRLH